MMKKQPFVLYKVENIRINLIKTAFSKEDHAKFNQPFPMNLKLLLHQSCFICKLLKAIPSLSRCHDIKKFFLRIIYLLPSFWGGAEKHFLFFKPFNLLFQMRMLSNDKLVVGI